MAYEDLNLKDWPFRVVPDQEFAQVWAGRRQTKIQLERALKKMQITSQSGLRVLWANFGMGKTHTLLHLRYRCQQSNNLLIPIYAVMPKRPTKFLDVYRAIVSELPYDFLGEQLVKLGSESSASVKSHQIFVKSPGIVSAILATRRDDVDQKIIAKQWLSAQPGLVKSQLAAIDVNYRISTPEDAINALTALTRLVLFKPSQSVPLPKLVIMLDEFQRIGELSPKTTQEINTALHTFFNENPKGLELILTFSFGRQDNVRFLLSKELQSRVDVDTITLDVLNEKDAHEFLHDLLSEFRISRDDRWAYPFAPEAIKIIIGYIAERQQITPRRLMKLADYVLREMLISYENDSIREISDVDVKKILENPQINIVDTDDTT